MLLLHVYRMLRQLPAVQVSPGAALQHATGAGIPGPEALLTDCPRVAGGAVEKQEKTV